MSVSGSIKCWLDYLESLPIDKLEELAKTATRNGRIWLLGVLEANIRAKQNAENYDQ